MTDSSLPTHRTKSSSKSHERPGTHPPGLLERAYPTEWSRPDWVALAPLCVAGILSGAGTYETLRSEPMTEYSSLLWLGAAFGIAGFAYRFFGKQKEVLVGDAGVALRQSGDTTRLLWWEIESIRYEAGHLVLAGATTTLRLPSVCHSRAIRAILGEAAERLPKIIDVKPKLVEELPSVAPGKQPAFEPVQSLQIAGKRCAVSKTVIAIERDARVCPVCTSVYHRDRLPKICVTCRCDLSQRVVAP